LQFFTGLKFLFPEHANAAGTTYYVDNCVVTGNDSNNGTDPTTPWLTINKVNNTNSFVAGDSILFRKGCTWREQLTVPSSGDATGNITFGAYGTTGANPIINGGTIVTGWTAVADILDTEQAEESTSGSSLRLGASSQVKIAMGYKPATNISVTRVQYKLLQNGTITSGNIWAEIYSDSAGLPNTLLATSINTIDATTVDKVTTTWYEFTFASYALTGGTQYHLVIAGDYTPSGTNKISWRCKLSNVYADGTRSTFDGTSTWTAEADRDQMFRVYKTVTTIWQATLSAAPSHGDGLGGLTMIPWAVYFNGTLGTEVATLAEVTSANKWYWASNVLYVYSTSDADTAFTSPGIEGVIRSYCIFADAKNYITYSNLDLTHGGYDGLRHENSAGITLDGIVSYWNGWGLLSGVNAEGISLAGITSLIVQNCTAHHNGWNGISTVRVSPSAIIQNSTAYSNNHNGFDFKAEDYHDTDFSGVKETANLVAPVIRYCLSYSNGQNGIYFEDDDEGHISNPSIYYNILYSNALSGIDLAKGDGAEINGALIYNNVAYANGQTGWGAGLEAYVTASTIRNNIFYYNQVHGDATRELYGNRGTGAVNSSNYNLIYHPINTSPIYWDGNTRTFANFQLLDSQEANGISSDPLFVSASNFTLRSTSPAINVGANLGSDYDDGLSPVSSWPSSVTTIDQDLRGSGWEIGAYVYPVPQAPTIGIPSVQSFSVIRWAFTDNSDDETEFRVYDNTDTLATSSATFAGISYLDETGLSANTAYSGRYVKAYNDYGESVASAVAATKYTLASAPGSLSGTAGLTTMDLSADNFTNSTAGSSGFLFSNSTKGTNSGWVTTNSWSDSGLSCGTSYTYTVQYKNGDGTETATASLSKSTNSCPGGGGMPPDWNNPPKAPVGGFKILINNNAQDTNTPNVILSLIGGSDTARMAISNFSDFRDAGQENYTTTKTWNVCWKNSILQTSSTCPAGTYTVYVKFYAPWGTNSGVVSDSIVLKTGVSSPNSPIPSSQTETNPLSPPTQSLAPFTKYLRFLQQNADVKRLQIFLNQNSDTRLANSGPGSLGKETNLFGRLTLKAVIKFQEKYAQDILAPWKLTKGTGFVGKTTIGKINQLLGF